MKKFLFLLIGIFLLLLTPVLGETVGGCQNLVIFPNTVYVLNHDITLQFDTGFVCLQIANTNITLDCQGHQIRGYSRGDKPTYGIKAVNNITIKNCTVAGFNEGIEIDSETIIENSTFIGNNVNTDGIVILGQNNIIKSNNINSNINGILIGDQNNTINGNNIESNSIGISISTSNNTVTNNNIESNSKEGILINGQNNTINGNNIKSNPIGILIYTSNNNIISANNISSGTVGISLSASGAWNGYNYPQSSSNFIEDNIITNNDDGILVSGGKNNEINGNLIKSNKIGIRMLFRQIVEGGYITNSFKCDENSITNNIITDSTYEGIRFENVECKSNQIYNNLFNNTNNADVGIISKLNQWSTTKRLGNKIYGFGKFIGGNYWTNSTGNGHSDNCTADENCLCKEKFTLAQATNEDLFPLASCWDMCLSNSCYTNATGEYNITNKDLNGNYFDENNCKYSRIGQFCPTGSSDTDNNLVQPINERRDYKVKGVCTANEGCVDGKCKQNIYTDNCSAGCIAPNEMHKVEKADINKDGKINIIDIALVAKEYGKVKSNPNWGENTDKANINKDSIINILDIALVAKEYGKDLNAPCLLTEFIQKDGICSIDPTGNCSKRFGNGWMCYDGRCANCTEIGCPEDTSCHYTGCSVNKCNRTGTYKHWKCTDKGTCEETIRECSDFVQPNKTCDPNTGEEKDATATLNCRFDNALKPYCNVDIYAYNRSAECNGHGICDVDTNSFFEQLKSEDCSPHSCDQGYCTNICSQNAGAQCEVPADCPCPIQGSECIDADKDGYKDDRAGYPSNGDCPQDTCQCDIGTGEGQKCAPSIEIDSADCPVCGNGVCQYPGETYSSCPQDCCEADCTADYDGVCHSDCNSHNGCSLTAGCNGKSPGSTVCDSSGEDVATCCNGNFDDCGDEYYQCCNNNCGSQYVDYYCTSGTCYGPEAGLCSDCGYYTCDTSAGSCWTAGLNHCSQTCGAQCDSSSQCSTNSNGHVCRDDCTCGCNSDNDCPACGTDTCAGNYKCIGNKCSSTCNTEYNPCCAGPNNKKLGTCSNGVCSNANSCDVTTCNALCETEVDPVHCPAPPFTCDLNTCTC